MAEDTDRITIILNEYENQNEWQRHNENQRAQLANVLLAIAAALVAFLPKERAFNPNDLLVTLFLIVIGVFGFLAITKYWERFAYHVELESAHRTLLDAYFNSNDNRTGDKEQGLEKKYLLIKTREEAIKNHEQKTSPLLLDKRLMQHWLWEAVFGIITLLGIVLSLKAILRI